MKTIVIANQFDDGFEIDEVSFDQDIDIVMSDCQQLESHIVYFSAGGSRIKEVLVQRRPVKSI